MGRKKSKGKKRELHHTTRGTTLRKTLDPNLLEKWPKVTNKIPPIFIHLPIDLKEFKNHANTMVQQGISFYYPLIIHRHIKIHCVSESSYKGMTQYLDKKHLPYHTYSLPVKRKIKVVIKGLPNEVDEADILSEFKYLSIPVLRIHRMQTKLNRDRPALFLAVISHDTPKILRVEAILGHPVTLEPPRATVEQCHRCQQWGHTQRFCRGKVKCVKCAGDHFSIRCTMNKTEPPTCANCNSKHTANFRECGYCPLSEKFKESQQIKKANAPRVSRNLPRVLYTVRV